MPQRKDMAQYFGGDNGRIKGYSQSQRYGGGGAGGDSFNPSAMFTNPLAMAMGAYNIGLQADASGTLQPTQDFGQMATLQSQQLNSLSPGVDPRQQTSLGKPLGAMYAMNPNTWKNRPGGMAGFGDAVSQRNQTFAEQFKIPDYSGGQQTGSPAATAGGGIPNPMRPGYAGPYRPGLTGTTEQQKIQNRAALQEQVDAKRMLGQATGDIPTVTIHPDMTGKTDGSVTISGKYGTGSSTFLRPTDNVAPTITKTPPTGGASSSQAKQGVSSSPKIRLNDADVKNIKSSFSADLSKHFANQQGVNQAKNAGSSTLSAPSTPRKEGLINGKPASEVLQGLANKPGIARAGDRFQPQKSTPAETKAMNTALSKLPMKNPLLKK